MIDDIGAESMTSWIRDDVLSVILQYRMQEQLVTFFSSNLDLKALEEHLTVTQRGEQEPLKSQTNYGTCALSVKRDYDDRK